MPKFGNKSTECLMSCHPELQRLFKEVVKHWDCTVTEGHRSPERQKQLFDEGRTTVLPPKSKHNKMPSMGIDVIPYPVNYKFEGELKKAAKAKDWNEYNKCLHNIQEWLMFIGFVKGMATSMDIKIRCGIDWNGNNKLSDNFFDDAPHFELVK